MFYLGIFSKLLDHMVHCYNMHYKMTVLLYIHITTDLRSESFVLWWQLIVGSSGIILRHKELKTIPLMHVVRVWNERGSPTGWVWNDRQASFSCDTNQIRCPISWLRPVWLLLALTGQTTACPWVYTLHNIAQPLITTCKYNKLSTASCYICATVGMLHVFPN